MVVLQFVSKEDAGRMLTRTCAPMDFAPGSQTAGPSYRYHFWDYESDSPGGAHTLSLRTAQIASIEATSESFDPAGFVSWQPRWHQPRDWGEFS